MSKTFTWSGPIETDKIRTHHAKIVVECTTGKPYYSIEWFDTAKQEYYLGYSSCCIDNVLGWLKEHFELVEAPMTNADRIRAMSDKELATMFTEICHGLEFCYSCPAVNNCPGESPALWLGWLKRPAEV